MKKEDAWAWQRQCVDPEGRRITEFEIMGGPERGKKIFKGHISLTVKVSPDPRVPPQKVPFDFEFPEGKNLEWCKKNYDNVANKAVTKWEEDQKKAQQEAAKKIIEVGGNNQGIIGPNGKIIKP
jgi:hypothetical protein